MICFVETAKPVELVHIEFTADPQRHFRRLVGQNAVQLIFLGAVEGDRKAARKLQSRFREHQDHGAWFRAAIPIRNYIAAIIDKPEAEGRTEAGIDDLAVWLNDDAQSELPPLLTIQEVAKMAAVSVPTVRRYVRAKLLPAVRVHSQLRFYPQDVLDSPLGAHGVNA